MKPLMHEGVVAVREEEPIREVRQAETARSEQPIGIGVSGADEARCSPDPMQRTDRYRLVTPYVSSSRDL